MKLAMHRKEELTPATASGGYLSDSDNSIVIQGRSKSPDDSIGQIYNARYIQVATCLAHTVAASGDLPSANTGTLPTEEATHLL